MKKKSKKYKNNIKYSRILILLIVFFMWCFTIEPNVVTVKKYNIKNEKLKGIKIVLAGDFHIKPYQEKRLKYIIEKINEQKPDIFLTIGDFINMHEEKFSYPIAKTTKELSKIKTKYGSYTVLGNHDYYRNGNKLKTYLEKNNIKVLENSSVNLIVKDKGISIAGIEDLTTGFPDLKNALKNVKYPTILLSHQPDIFPKVPQNVDLVLAGHVHGGQIVIPFWGPIIVPSMYGKKYAYGKIDENNKTMIVTNGLGTSILPIRLNCPPEIVVINFK